MTNFKNKKIAVLGLGLEGASSVNFFLKRGSKVTVFDYKEKNLINPEFLRKIERLKVDYVLGDKYIDNLSGYDLIMRSPGIKLDKLIKKIKLTKKITSQTKLFFDLCPCKIIGVTGTKGKGTTASIIYEMLRKSGEDVYLVGNIGQPPLDILDRLSAQSIVVLELSSFQLLDLKKSPHIAVLLMITSEHLDYHRDIHEYIEAKRNILRFQAPADYLVLNRDYPASLESDIHANGKKLEISREGNILGEGCFVKDNVLICRLEGKEERVIDIDKVLLPGRHNLDNISAATAVAKLLKVKNKTIVEVLETFKGLEHRLELAGIVDGVKYYNDSFSTIPETAIAAIEAFDEPLILILGGSSKKSNFEELGEIIAESTNIKAVIGIGEEWQRIKATIPSSLSPQVSIVEGAKDMETIVKAASKIAASGDIVLLSPACASFDMFKNYKDRGEQFKNEVKKLGKSN